MAALTVIGGVGIGYAVGLFLWLHRYEQVRQRFHARASKSRTIPQSASATSQETSQQSAQALAAPAQAQAASQQQEIGKAMEQIGKWMQQQNVPDAQPNPPITSAS